MNGWIKIHRNILRHRIWEDKPFSKGQAWIDLLLIANYSNISGNKCGSIVTTESSLMERWGWTRKKVQLFLRYLEKEFMISKLTNNKRTIIIVTNYEAYQGISEKKEKLYIKNSSKKNRSHSNGFNNFTGRKYDYEQLEKDLLESN